MPQRRHVALLIETSNAYARGLLEGVTRYVKEQDWSVYLAEHGRGDRAPRWLRRWDGDGIIARIENASIASAVSASRLPAVDLSAARLVPSLPCVETDNEKVAYAAAQHLLQRGFRQFGFCGLGRFKWAQERCEHFVRFVDRAGGVCAVHMTSARAASETAWESEQRRLAAWIHKLPKPAGVMACYDIHGQQLLDACRRAGVRVPDDVAVIGVDNDALLCELSEPALSSVILNSGQTGYRAAQFLDWLMSGRRVSATAHLIGPLGVATRRSTDVLAIDDADVAAAVRCIRDRACEGIGVDAVAEAVALSRRALETRFMKLLGYSPHEAIMRVQLERARELLAQTDMPVKTIASRTAFRHAEYFSVRFKMKFGASPAEYRRAQRN